MPAYELYASSDTAWMLRFLGPPGPWQHSAPVVFGRVDDHQLYYCAELQQHRCQRCNASASTRASLHTIRSGSLRRCSPTPVEQAMAAAYFRDSAHTWHLVGDDRVALAIDSLTRQVDMELSGRVAQRMQQ